MKCLTAVLLAVSCLPTVAVAQSGDTGVQTTEQRKAGEGTVRHEQRAEGVFEIIQHPNGTVSERQLPPAEVADGKANGVIHTVNGEHLCRGEANTQPRRLAPGESGELKVLITFAGKAVALPGPHIQLTIDPLQGFQFGTPVLEPAAPGKLPGKFEGQPVYDDSMLFRVPMTVGNDVRSPQETFVKGALKLELHDGKSGQKLGEFTTPVAGRIRIGKSLPQIRAAVGARSGAAESSTDRPTAPPGTAGGSDERRPAATDRSQPVPTGPRASGATDAEGVEPGAPIQPGAPSVAQFTDSILVWGLGGLGLIVLLILTVARRN